LPLRLIHQAILCCTAPSRKRRVRDHVQARTFRRVGDQGFLAVPSKMVSVAFATASAVLQSNRTNLSSSSFTVSQRPLRSKVTSPKSQRVQMSLTPVVARSLIGVYGVVIAGGGLGAYIRTKSTMSGVSGAISGLVLAAAFATENTPLALGTAVALSIVFAVRYAKTGKVVPAGALCLASIIFAAAFAYAIYA
jgi:uncharacterized membrane protein (UPF0136 family)